MNQTYRKQHWHIFEFRLMNVWLGAFVLVGMLAVFRSAIASDHLDTPTVISDPAADIGDIFAWTSSDGQRLNLVMDVVAHRFSDRLLYVFHVDSGKQFGKTTATTLIVCRFDAANAAECWAGNADYVHGDASDARGIEGRNRRFRVFAGLRDDPFFNNVKGTRAMYELAVAALKRGTPVDKAGCPEFDQATSRAILNTWRQTNGGAAANFLAGWKSSSLVISIDLDVVTTGGSLLAIWGAVNKTSEPNPSQTNSRETPAMPTLGEQIERTARPLIKNALVGGPLSTDTESNQRKEAYNRAVPGNWAQFSADIQKTLGFYDGFDGVCGNQWLAEGKAKGAERYERLAKVLADDRLWVNSKSTRCTEFLAVELAEFKTPGASSTDCGGRTPNYDASNIFRSLLVNGTTTGVDDGLKNDDKVHSITKFPFLAAP
jgi:Domain of unknown function (DUF4331)